MLTDVLALLEAESGPLLVDFADEAPASAPAQEEEEGWACPVALAPPATNEDDIVAAVRAEVALLLPWYDLAVEDRGRTTADSSGLAVEAMVDTFAAFLDGLAGS